MPKIPRPHVLAIFSWLLIDLSIIITDARWFRETFPWFVDDVKTETQRGNQTKPKHRWQTPKQNQQGNIKVQHIRVPAAFCEPWAMQKAWWWRKPKASGIAPLMGLFFNFGHQAIFPHISISVLVSFQCPGAMSEFSYFCCVPYFSSFWEVYWNCHLGSFCVGKPEIGKCWRCKLPP